MREALVTLVAAVVGGYLGTWLYIRTRRGRARFQPEVWVVCEKNHKAHVMNSHPDGPCVGWFG
jgi:hypothetical protein